MTTKFPVDADTINAITSGLGAIVFAMVRQLPPERRSSFADDLARMARQSELAGLSTEETLLPDLHRAAMSAQ